MGYEQSLTKISLRAPSTALSTRQYCLVRSGSTEGFFALGTSGANTVAIGVLQDAPTQAGEACSIGYGGVSKIVVGSTALVPGSAFVVGLNGVAASSSEAVAKSVLYGPWLSAGQSTGTIGMGFVRPIGITT